jgi:DNA ligase-associated metallophosphoesterase
MPITPDAALPIQLENETLWLLADKALYWPDRAVLMVADPHFGKAAAFRALGQPVPRGTTTNNLRRLDLLLARYPCRLLICLGDVLHARQSHAPGTLAALQAWRSRHAGLDITLVRGNHDRHAGDPPAGLGIEVVEEPLLLGPFALQHEPHPHPGHTVLAGHLHPVCRLRGRGRQQLRLPCFSWQPGLLLLPSFGDFTGGLLVQPAPRRRLFAVADGGVWPLPVVGDDPVG